MERIYLDTEFSSMFSYDEKKSGEILQLSAIAVKDGIEISRFDEMIKPISSVWSFEAEKVHGIPKRIAMLQRDPELVIYDFIVWLDSLGDELWTICAFNCSGDKFHLTSLLMKYNFLTKFFSRTRTVWRDVFVEVKNKGDYISTKSRKLSDLCKHYGIAINAHNAIEDCIGTWKLDEILSQIKLPNKNYMSMNLDGLSKKDKIERFISMKYMQSGSDGSLYLSKHATSNPEAMMTILEHLWDIHCA